MGNTVDLIKKYIDRGFSVYIETGSAGGDGIANAVEAGMKYSMGIECNQELYDRSRKRFSKAKANIYHGQSESYLLSAIRMLENYYKGQRIIFFLDAHKLSSDPKETYPLEKELKIIKLAKRKDHLIMIDDVRLFGKELTASDVVIDLIKQINPHYVIGYEDSSTDRNDVLVAGV